MYNNREFWSKENLKFATPHYRLRKCADVISKIAGDRQCDLLDVGCGPAALQDVLPANISYFGIDIAIHAPAPNLIESDFLESPIRFNTKKFDIVVAQGVFEYMGEFQEQKFAEINDLLKEDGHFVATYVNFNHRAPTVYWPYNNVQSLSDFRTSLARHLTVEKYFPTSHNWHHSEPGRPLIQAVQVPVRLPVISHYLAVEYFFICSRRSERSGPADGHVQDRAGTGVGARMRLPQAVDVVRKHTVGRSEGASRARTRRRYGVLAPAVDPDCVCGGPDHLRPADAHEVDHKAHNLSLGLS
jgi:SAM-dependent methyltransferase